VDPGVDVTDVADGSVWTVRDDGEVEQSQVETSTARGDYRPRTARRPEASVLGDGASQVVWAVVTGLDFQPTDVLTWRKYRPRLYYSASCHNHTHSCKPNIKGKKVKVL